MFQFTNDALTIATEGLLTGNSLTIATSGLLTETIAISQTSVAKVRRWGGSSSSRKTEELNNQLSVWMKLLKINDVKTQLDVSGMAKIRQDLDNVIKITASLASHQTTDIDVVAEYLHVNQHTDELSEKRKRIQVSFIRNSSSKS